MPTRRHPPSDASLGLIDYVMAALLRLGGDGRVVDLEDIAVEAYKLAPDRFRWRRHDYPNLELVRVTLSDANKRGPLVLYDRKGRKLTVEGIRLAAEVLSRLDYRSGGAARRRAPTPRPRGGWRNGETSCLRPLASRWTG